MELKWMARDSVGGAVFGCYFINNETNCVLLCMRPGMAMKFGFPK